MGDTQKLAAGQVELGRSANERFTKDVVGKGTVARRCHGFGSRKGALVAARVQGAVVAPLMLVGEKPDARVFDGAGILFPGAGFAARQSVILDAEPFLQSGHAFGIVGNPAKG